MPPEHVGSRRRSTVERRQAFEPPPRAAQGQTENVAVYGKRMVPPVAACGAPDFNVPPARGPSRRLGAGAFRNRAAPLAAERAKGVAAAVPPGPFKARGRRFIAGLNARAAARPPGTSIGFHI